MAFVLSARPAIGNESVLYQSSVVAPGVELRRGFQAFLLLCCSVNGVEKTLPIILGALQRTETGAYVEIYLKRLSCLTGILPHTAFNPKTCRTNSCTPHLQSLQHNLSSPTQRCMIQAVELAILNELISLIRPTSTLSAKTKQLRFKCDIRRTSEREPIKVSLCDVDIRSIAVSAMAQYIHWHDNYRSRHLSSSFLTEDNVSSSIPRRCLTVSVCLPVYLSISPQRVILCFLARCEFPIPLACICMNGLIWTRPIDLVRTRISIIIVEKNE
jgi:hypothetical protein